MRLTRPALAICLAGILAAAALPASAAPKPVKITDLAGDANAINGQGFSTAVPATSTAPAQVAGADILSISFLTMTTTQKVKGKTVTVPNGLQVTMTLAAPPQVNVLFRATPVPAGCSTFSLSYSKLADGGETSGLRHNCPGFVKDLPTDTYEDAGVDSAVASGSTITWKMRAKKALPAAVVPGTVFKTLSGHTRFYAGTTTTGGATVPALDEAAGAGTFTYGK